MPRASVPFVLACLVVLGVAAFFRFDRLALKPFHHDESVNHGFMERFIQNGRYRYDPHNYHGPALYELAYLPGRVFGLDEIPLRAMPALMGCLAIVFLLAMSPWIGRAGALFAAAAMAVSAADVYFSRTFIHEIYLVAFFAGATWFGLRYRRTAGLIDLAGLLAFTVLALGTKETAALSLASVGAAAFVAHRFGADDGETWRWPWQVRPARGRWTDLAGGAVVLWALLFSTFGTNPRGLFDFFAAFAAWFQTGVAETGHEKPVWYFARLLGIYSWPLLAAALPAVVTAIRQRAVLPVFFSVWFACHLLIYSVIPYKTPWCLVSLVFPLFPLAGLGISAAAERLTGRKAVAALGLVGLAAALVPYGLFSYRMNFRGYDDDGYAMVYVQTRRGYLGMIDGIGEAAAHAQGLHTPIMLVDAKHPTPFYLRHYDHTSWLTDAPEGPITEPIVVAGRAQAEAVRAALGAEYEESEFPVWPGQRHHLFVRADLLTNATPGEDVAP